MGWQLLAPDAGSGISRGDSTILHMSKGFDWVAPLYTSFESLAHGDALSVARLAFIEAVFKGSRVDVDGLHIPHSTFSQRWVERLNYGFDRLLSGVEADRYYDPLPVIHEGGWVVKQKKYFLKGAVLARALRRIE